MYDMYPDRWTEQESQRSNASVRRDDEAQPRRRQRKLHSVSPPVVRIQAERP